MSDLTHERFAPCRTAGPPELHCGAAARVWLFCVGMRVHAFVLGGLWILSLPLASSLGGCSKAPQGGAVELSWALRDHTDGFVGCGETAIAFMRLSWSVVPRSSSGDGAEDGGPIPLAGSDFWPCNNNDERHGVTGFEVPEGDAMFALSPECEANDPAVTAHYRAPPPIPRRVTLGEIVTLGALVIEIDKEQICQQPEVVE